MLGVLPRLRGAERRATLAAVLVLCVTAVVASVGVPGGAVVAGVANAVAAVGLLWLIARDRGSARAAKAVTPSDVSDYIAVLAHELSGPIVSVGAAAQVLAKELHGRAAERTALGIAEESRQIYSLLEALSDLSALESGRLSLSLRARDLGELLRGGIALVPAPDHPLVVDVPAERIPVSADDRRIRQVVRNLLENAAKYSAVGTQIELRAGTTADHRSAIVQVRDHGPGVPPTERGRLFEKFVRLSTAGGTRGSGLGLFICRAIVREHGGDIWGEWPASGGSIFSFTIPLARSRAPAEARAEITAG
jgi:two-component system sensor histidine kinase KdpD